MVLLMTEPRESTYDEPTAVYEIRLRGALPAGLRQQFPTAAVLATRTETVLFRRVERPGELDDLIAHLLSLGLVLNEVHEVQLPRQTKPVAAHAPDAQEDSR